MHYISTDHLIAVIRASARASARVPHQCSALPQDMYQLHKTLACAQLQSLMATIRHEWPTNIQPDPIYSRLITPECGLEDHPQMAMHGLLAASRSHPNAGLIIPQIIRLHSILQWLNTLELRASRAIQYMGLAI